jgi:hypothetical protein
VRRLGGRNSSMWRLGSRNISKGVVGVAAIKRLHPLLTLIHTKP